MLNRANSSTIYI